jgi:hypothetical protein
MTNMIAWCLFFYDNPDEIWSTYLDCKVYVPKESIWKKNEGSLFNGNRSLKFDMPVFHNGAVHFISDCFPYVEKGFLYGEIKEVCVYCMGFNQV